MKLTIQEMQNIETEMLNEVSRICEKNNIDYFLAYGSVIGAIRHDGPIPWDPDADIVVPYDKFDDFIKIVREELPDRFYLDYYDINKHFTATFPRIGMVGYSTVRLHVDVFMATGLPNDKNKQKCFCDRTYKLRKMHYYKLASEKYRGKIGVLGKIKILLYRILYIGNNLKSIRREFHQLCRENPFYEARYVTNPSGGYGYKEIIPREFYGMGKLHTYGEVKMRVPEKAHEYLQHFYGNYKKLPPKEERIKTDCSFEIIPSQK